MNKLFPYKNNNNNQLLPFIIDKPIERHEDDIYDYGSDVAFLKKRICDLDMHDQSFSVGILAPWGKGKTSFMNLLALEFKSDNSDIIINFNPRHSKSTSLIQSDFFMQFFSSLQTYQPVPTDDFVKYLKTLNVITGDRLMPLLSLWDIGDRESEKERINELIRNIGRRIIVFIDDFDRLLADEIIEIFKIIDGSGSFCNTIFITAYDKEVVDNILKDRCCNDRVSFLDKFFNVEIQIPLRPYRMTYNYLEVELLSKLDLKEEEVDIYKVILLKNYDTIEKVLTTLRDVKRFVNQFVTSYRQVKNEVEFRDFFILQLIKYRFPKEYSKLHSKEYVEKDQFGKIYSKKEVSCSCSLLIDLLFCKEETSPFRSIKNIDAYDIYFHEMVYDKLTVASMENTLKLDNFDVLKDTIEGYELEQIKEYETFLYYKNVFLFNDKNIFERYLDILLYLYGSKSVTNRIYLKIINLISSTSKQAVESAYNYNDKEYKNLWLEKLDSSKSFTLLKLIILMLLKREDDIIFTVEELKEKTGLMLRDYIDNFKTGEFNIDALYCCIDRIDPETSVISLTKDAIANMNAFIEMYPGAYLENFVRLGLISSNNEHNTIACEPYWNDLYRTPEEFAKVVSKYQGKNSERVQRFWNLYASNDYKPLQFEQQGDVKNKIDSDLKAEARAFKKLKMSESDDYKLTSTDLDEMENAIPAFGKLREKFENQKTKFKLVN